MCYGVLKRLEGRIDLQGVGNVARTFRLQIIPAQTANEGQIALSLATNVFARRHGKRARHGGAPDGRECGVGAKHVSELSDALSGVLATTNRVKAAELVVLKAVTTQACRQSSSVHRAVNKKVKACVGQATHLSEVRLLFGSTSATALAPSTRRAFHSRL